LPIAYSPLFAFGPVLATSLSHDTKINTQGAMDANR